MYMGTNQPFPNSIEDNSCEALQLGLWFNDILFNLNSG